MNEESEKYIVLLLGVKDDPIPSLWHLQKEMFVISRAVPKVNTFFDFEKHHYGSYSSILQEITKELLYYDDAYEMLAKIPRDQSRQAPSLVPNPTI